jgi:O-antigen/teichoic acid export membrane protein
MIRPVIGTLASRISVAVLNLLVIALAAQRLGASGVGAMSLIVLGITFILLLNNVVGGGGLVYLVPRYATSALRWPTYGWAVLTALVAFAVLWQWPLLVPEGYAGHTVALAFLQAITGVHHGLLLGRERYGVGNALMVAQPAILLLAFVLLLRHDGAVVMDYVHAAYIAFGTIAVVSGLLTIDRSRRQATGSAWAGLFRQGVPAQLANALQLINYRLVYYLVERAQGLVALGTFSITTQLAESAWLAPRSLGSVLYARVSNMREAEQQRALTLVVWKVAVGIALVALVVLLVLPDAVYRMVFGPEVQGIAAIVAWMAPGLLAMSASQALSHYLSGTGRVYHNAIASGLGALVTVLVGPWAISAMGLYGAGLTTSAAYMAATGYQTIVFGRLTGARPRHYLPDARDAERLRTLLGRVLGR